MKNNVGNNNIKHLTGLIGSPVSHSMSPMIHKQLFHDNKMEGYDYILIDSAKRGLAHEINSLDERFVGFNVTMPNKVEIIDYLDEISNEAKSIGAVNTVKIQDGKLIGYNTDGKGFLNALIKNGVDINNKNAVIYGAGGAAKAIQCELVKNNANVTLLHRPTDDELKHFLEDCDVFINASPVGMDGVGLPINEFTGCKDNLFVADIIYNPSETNLIKLAKLAGFKTMNGLDMLYEQAKLSFNIFHF